MMNTAYIFHTCLTLLGTAYDRRQIASVIQSRNRPLSSFEKRARRFRSSQVSFGWHRSYSDRIKDSSDERARPLDAVI